jgi:hypothetical protein
MPLLWLRSSRKRKRYPYAGGDFKGNVNRRQISNFQPPAFVSLDTGVGGTGIGAPEGNLGGALGVHTINAMTRNRKTTHYYWEIAQDRTTKEEN